MNRDKAKQMLDGIINKSRVHLYKPIQIAEILYRHRVCDDIDLYKLEDYRTKSKKWRDKITMELLNTKCTSSSKFQDDLFNAIPPDAIATLGIENCKKGQEGIVEAYVYKRFTNKHDQMENALNICLNSSKETFFVEDFINSFTSKNGLKRSLDKMYEIIVYSLFDTLLEEMEFSVEVSINKEKYDLLEEFQEFTQVLLGINIKEESEDSRQARVYRVGVTNAADRGLDMYSNWGSVVQIKHLSLNEELAEDIVSGVTSDRIVIVCKDADEKVILSLLNQIGWKSRIQSIITETQLIEWYELVCRGKYKDLLGDRLLETLANEIKLEFPSVGEVPKTLKERGYKEISLNEYWTI